MVDPNDWRLNGQLRYLCGVDLCWRTYRQYPKDENWDHDHCAFCWAKFMVVDYPEVLHAGYCTVDEYHWICSSCFNDFHEIFGWHVVPVANRDA